MGSVCLRVHVRVCVRAEFGSLYSCVCCVTVCDCVQAVEGQVAVTL